MMRDLVQELNIVNVLVISLLYIPLLLKINPTILHQAEGSPGGGDNARNAFNEVKYTIASAARVYLDIRYIRLS